MNHEELEAARIVGLKENTESGRISLWVLRHFIIVGRVQKN